MKHCPRCKKTKSAAAYGRRKVEGRWYLKSWCKLCEAQTNRAYFKANPEKRKARDRQFKERHPDRRRIQFAEAEARRQARLTGASSEPYSRRFVYERDEGICGICHGLIDWSLSGWDQDGFTIDHLTPISMGGTDTLDNVRSAHRRCNTRRGAARGVVIVKRRKVLV